LKILASPSILAKIFTGEAAIGLGPLLAGVGPQKIQKPLPAGQ
jgi:hypothetical protein